MEGVPPITTILSLFKPKQPIRLAPMKIKKSGEIKGATIELTKKKVVIENRKEGEKRVIEWRESEKYLRFGEVSIGFEEEEKIDLSLLLGFTRTQVEEGEHAIVQ